MLAKESYTEHPPRFDYRLTDQGTAFGDVLVAMWNFGAAWLWDEPPPTLVTRSAAPATTHHP